MQKSSKKDAALFSSLFRCDFLNLGSSLFGLFLSLNLVDADEQGHRGLDVTVDGDDNLVLTSRLDGLASLNATTVDSRRPGTP